MKNKYTLISVVLALLALGCLSLGIKGFLEEKNAGSEYETVLSTDKSTEIAVQDTEETQIFSTEIVEATEHSSEADGEFFTREDIDFEELKKRNPDIYAWIEVPGTNVDYPIVQHPEDNSYYLNYTIDHKKTVAASIYTENYNSTDFEDHHTVIYGHNMKNGTMFRTLHNFEDNTFFEENRDVIIYMPDQTRYYKVFAAYTYDNRHLLNTYYCEEPESFQQYLDEVFATKDFSAHIDHDMEVTGDDKVITLSTCVNSGDSTQRYLVQAVLVSIDN